MSPKAKKKRSSDCPPRQRMKSATLACPKCGAAIEFFENGVGEGPPGDPWSIYRDGVCVGSFTIAGGWFCPVHGEPPTGNHWARIPGSEEAEPRGKDVTVGGKPVRIVRVFDLGDALRMRGFEILDHATDADWTARSGDLLVRVMRDREEIRGARREGFDRWANSGISGVLPYSEAELDDFLGRIT